MYIHRYIHRYIHTYIQTGLDMNLPTYGFHTKWSSDGRVVMFIVRTLHEKKSSIFDIFTGTYL
jgi:hypothetical protein